MSEPGIKDPYWQGWLRGHYLGRNEHKRDAYYDILAALQVRQRNLPEGESLCEISKCIALVESMMPPPPEANPSAGPDDGG